MQNSVVVENLGSPLSLAQVMSALEDYLESPLTFSSSHIRVRPGYHVTEVKAGQFTTLDCGGNPDSWAETVLQVEDIDLDEGRNQMTARKFNAILGRVAEKVDLNKDARLTIEVSRPGDAMSVHDVAAVEISATEVVLKLVGRPAICKPRHRAEMASRVEASNGQCCGTNRAGASCCG